MVDLIDCLWRHHKQDLPALILAYATIDAFATLDRPDDQAPPETRTPGVVFRAWVERYLLPGSEIDATPSELWFSRCGLLHAFSPEAERRAATDRRICFLTGNALVWKGISWTAEEAMARGIAIVGPHQIFDALPLAIDRFLEEAEREDSKRALLEAREQELYVDWVRPLQ
jgi:hypothetical protein